MKITATAKEILQSGDWLKFCEMKGVGEYAINEGMDDNEEFSFSKEEAESIGLLKTDEKELR